MEAVAKHLPEADLLIPHRGEDLAALMTVTPSPISDRELAVLWLDGLERFLESLAPEALEGLRSESMVVATIADDAYAAALEAGNEAAYSARRVWNRANRFSLCDVLSEDERDRAAQLYPGVDFHQPFTESLPASGASAPPSQAPRSVPLRKAVSEAMGVAWRGDRLLKALAVLLLGSLGGVLALVLTGEWRNETVSVGDRIEAIKNRESKAGRITVVSLAADLRGFGEKSFLMVFRDRAPALGDVTAPIRPPRSDTVKVYDVKDGKPEEKLSFEPRGIRTYRFGLRATADLDGNGTTEIVGGWAEVDRFDHPPANGASRPLPVAIARDDQAGRYVQHDLLPSPARFTTPLTSPDGEAATDVAKQYRQKVSLVDVSDDKPSRLSGYSAEEVGVADPGPDGRLVAAYLVQADKATSPQAIEIRAWPFRFDTGAPKLGEACVVLGGEDENEARQIVTKPSRSVSIDVFITARWAQLQQNAAC